VTQDSLVIYEEIRPVMHVMEFSVRKTSAGFIGKTADGETPAEPDVVQKLIYALRTSQWKEVPTAHPTNDVCWTRVRYKFPDGTEHGAFIDYDQGGWFMQRDDGKFFQSYYPDLLYQVQEAIEHRCRRGE
jgi:hypothetical protein